MKLHELKAALSANAQGGIRMILPDGDRIPDEFHVTEVGYVSKKFIDCGGTARASDACVLQAWVSESDREHRLSAGKLGSILEMARGVLPNDDLEVEVEYERCAISQYSLLSAEPIGDTVTLRLESKHTDCLAKEACGVEAGGCGPEGGKCC
jgi:hypothetical protein